MMFFFIDDSIQKKPCRPKMGPLVSVGGFVAAAQVVKHLEQDLDALCSRYKFPKGEPFKWSPERGLWMYSNLVETSRFNFLAKVIQTLDKYDCKTIFIAEDTKCQSADNSSRSHEVDVAKLLIERVDWYFAKKNATGAIIIDRHGGSKRDEEEFLRECLETLRAGTDYQKPSNIILPVLSSPSRLSRLLQAADIIAGCTLAYVCGERNYSPTLMKFIIPLFVRESGRVGGVGVKLHPFLKYGNLYHWLFQDKHYLRGGEAVPLPIDTIAFGKSIGEY